MGVTDKKPKSQGFSEAQSPYVFAPSTYDEEPNEIEEPVVELETDHDPFAELVGSGGSEAAFTAEDARSRRGNYIVPFGVTPKHPPRLSVIVSFMVSRICHFARVFFLSCLNSVAPG